jgi:hypothetical protein
MDFIPSRGFCQRQPGFYLMDHRHFKFLRELSSLHSPDLLLSKLPCLAVRGKGVSLIRHLLEQIQL